MKGKIIQGKVLVKEIQPEEKTKSGIYKPNIGRKHQAEGKVVLKGEGVDDIITGTVVFNPHIGVRFTLDDEEFILVNAKDIYYIR